MKIEGIEIFAVGDWRGNRKIKVTSETLDEMMASYGVLGSTPGFRPPLVIGHTRSPGEMAYGWVERIYRAGNKILADFADVPEYLVYLMQTKRYNAVSVEMYPQLDYNGTIYQNVLSAVAVLGAELPAVKGLKPLSESVPAEFSAAAKGELVQLTKEEDVMITFTQEQHDALTAVAVAAAVAAAKAEGVTALAAANEQIETLTASAKTNKEAREAAEAALTVFKREATDKELAAFTEQAIKDGKMLPKQRDNFIAMAKSMSGVIKVGETEVSPLDLLKTFVSEGTKIDFSERGGANPNPGGATKASDEVVRRAKHEQERDAKLTFGLAVEKVLAADPALKQAYFAEA